MVERIKMELKNQEPVMTSTPLAYRCRKNNDIEVSPIYPVTERKIKSMVPTFRHHIPTVVQGRRKTDTHFIKDDFGKSSNLTSEAKSSLQFMKKPLIMKLQNQKIAECSDENISEGVDLKEANRETAVPKKNKSSTNKENSDPLGTTDIPNKKTSNLSIFKSTEQLKSSNLEWCIPEETKRSYLSKRKSIHQHLKESVVPNSKHSLMKGDDQSLTEEASEEMSPLDISYPLKKKQKILKNEIKTPHTIIVKDTIPKSPCTDDNNDSRTYVLIQQDDQSNSNKICSNNKGNIKQTLTNVRPKRMKKEGSIIEDEQIKLLINSKTEPSKVDEGKAYDKMSEKCDKSVSCTKPRGRISKKITKTQEPLKTKGNKKKHIEGNSDVQFKKSTITKDSKLSSSKENTEQTLPNIRPKRMKRGDNNVKPVGQTKFDSTNTRIEQTKPDEEKEYVRKGEQSSDYVSYTQHRSRISKKTITTQEFLNSGTNENKCVEDSSDTQFNQVNITEDNKLSSNKKLNKKSLPTNIRPKRMKKEDNGIKADKMTTVLINAGTEQTTTNEGKDCDEMNEKFGKSVSCTKPRLRISKITTNNQESLKTGTNEKKCVEDIPDVSSTIIKDANNTQNKNCIGSENKEVAANKIIPIKNFPMSCTVVINKTLEKHTCKKGQDTKSIQLNSSNIPIKRTGLRNKISTRLTETVVNDVTNNLKKKTSIKSEPHRNEETESDSQVANLIHKNYEIDDNENASSNPSENKRVFNIKSCFETKKDSIIVREGAVMHVFIHISNYVMTGICTVHPGGCITKASTNTTYFVVNGTATVKISPLTKIIRCEDVNCSFFIPKGIEFSIRNEEKIDLKMFFTKFND